MENSSLADYTGGGESRGERPAEEAAVVAGNGDGAVTSELVDASSRRYPDADGVIELAVTQVDYTIEGSGADERAVLHVFGRTRENAVEHVRVHEFEPYFYVPLDSFDGAATAEEPVAPADLADSRLENDRITGCETDDDGTLVLYESIRGERLVKVFGQTPRDVGQLRDRFSHYEADILFPNRLLIDKDITSGVRVPCRRAADDSLDVHHDEVDAVEVDADLRVCTFDIEVDDRSGFPEDGEEPILCLTSHDSYRDEYVNWLYEAPGGEAGPDALDDFDPISDGATYQVRRFDSEAAMLAAFLDYVEDSTDPDVLTGWNCVPADSDVLMADGREVEIQDVRVGDTVVGSEEQRTHPAVVTNKWKSEKQIHEFELADGDSLRSSADHRIMVGDDDAVDWKRGEDVEPGDFVLKPRRLTVDEPTVPALRELVPAENQRFAERESITSFKERLPYGAISELADELDLVPESLYHPYRDHWTPARCELAADRFGVAMPDGGRIYRRSGTDLDRELTGEELYLAGLVLTDGTMSRDQGIRFYNTREELHQQFPGDNQLTPDGKGCYKQNVLDYASMYAYNGLGIPFGDKNATDVDLSRVFQMPEEFIARFLAGVIDGDGCVSSDVSISAANPTIGDWYVKLLRRLGIYAQQRGRTVRIPDAHQDIDRLKNQVHPHMRHSTKAERLEAFDGGKSGQTENIPYALFEAGVGSDEKRIGNDKHRRGINLKRHETSSTEWDEFVFVEVTDVSVAGTETTYDIETSTHNFFADGCLVHNCDDFDAPYLVDRLNELGPNTGYDLDYNRLSRVNEVWESNWGGPNIKGRVLFDLLYGYKRTQFTELDSYRLDAVGEVELGIGKERYAGSIGDLWETDPERLLEYNTRDVELCVELDRKQQVIAFFEEVATFVGCKLEDAPTPGDAVDMYVLHKAHDRFALPSKGQQEAEDFEGGAVFDPISGVMEMVSVLDLKSLYPMAMTTINASPETKVDPAAYDGETYRAPNGQHFRKQPDGMMREMIDELLTEREEKKSLRNEHQPGAPEYELYDRQQGAVKVIMNSLYGVSGWDRFRLYDKENAAAVTATGREVINFTETAVTELGHDVAYGDTDSVMLSLGDMSKEEAIGTSFDIEEYVNGRYDDFAGEELNAERHRFEIEFEKLYRRFFQAGKKKRYAGHIVWKEGKDVDDIDITGFEYKRSDIAPITKEVQQHVLDLIVTSEGDDYRDAVTEYVHDVIQEFKAGDVSVEEIGIPGGIGKRLDNYDTDTAHVRGAKYANLLLGTNFARGSKPKRLYLEKVHPSFFERVEADRGLDAREHPLYGEFKRDPDVICIEYDDQLPEEFRVDYDKMLEKTLKGPIERIIEAVGVSWDEVESGQEQTGLGSFM